MKRPESWLCWVFTSSEIFFQELKIRKVGWEWESRVEGDRSFISREKTQCPITESQIQRMKLGLKLNIYKESAPTHNHDLIRMIPFFFVPLAPNEVFRFIQNFPQFPTRCSLNGDSTTTKICIYPYYVYVVRRLSLLLRNTKNLILEEKQLTTRGLCTYVLRTSLA